MHQLKALHSQNMRAKIPNFKKTFEIDNDLD